MGSAQVPPRLGRFLNVRLSQAAISSCLLLIPRGARGKRKRGAVRSSAPICYG